MFFDPLLEYSSLNNIYNLGLYIMNKQYSIVYNIYKYMFYLIFLI